MPVPGLAEKYAIADATMMPAIAPVYLYTVHSCVCVVCVGVGVVSLGSPKPSPQLLHTHCLSPPPARQQWQHFNVAQHTAMNLVA